MNGAIDIADLQAGDCIRFLDTCNGDKLYPVTWVSPGKSTFKFVRLGVQVIGLVSEIAEAIRPVPPPDALPSSIIDPGFRTRLFQG